MFSRLLLPLLLVASVACAPHNARTLPLPAGCDSWAPLPMTVRLDESAADYRDEVNHAMKTWDRALGRPAFVWAYLEDAPSDVLVAANQLRVIGLRGFGPSFCLHDRANPRVAATVVIDLNMDTIEAVAVTTHELGHALGLGHSTARASIMAPEVHDSLMSDWDTQRIQYVTEGDARIVLALHEPNPPRLADVDDVDDEPAAVLRAPDPEKDPGGFMSSLFDAAKKGEWRLLAGLMLMVIVWAARRWGSKAWPWLETDRGGAALVLFLALCGGLATALAGDGPLGLGLIANSVAMAFSAAGGYAVLKKLLSPSDGT